MTCFLIFRRKVEAYKILNSLSCISQSVFICSHSSFCHRRWASSPFALDSTPPQHFFFCSNDLFNFSLSQQVLPSWTQTLNILDYPLFCFQPQKKHDPLPTLTVPQTTALCLLGFAVKLLERVTCTSCFYFPSTTHSSI